MARLLTATEIADFLSRNPIQAADVQPWGALVTDLGRKIVVFKKVDGTLIFSDASDIPMFTDATAGSLDGQFPNGVKDADLTVIEGQMVVASLPAIAQRAIKETVETVASGAAGAVDFAGKVVLNAAAGAGKGLAENSGLGTLAIVAGLALAGFILWKL